MIRSKRIWYRIALGVTFLAVVFLPVLFGAGNTWQTLPAAGGVVAAIIAIERAGASDEAASKAEKAGEAAQKAATAAHLALAIHHRPQEAGADWERRPWKGKEQWVLLPYCLSQVSDVVAEWHFTDGRPPLNASFKEIVPKDFRGRPDQELVIPLGIDATIPIAELHTHVVWGRLDYTDRAGLAVWQST